jgi:hypothetical protein
MELMKNTVLFLNIAGSRIFSLKSFLQNLPKLKISSLNGTKNPFIYKILT